MNRKMIVSATVTGLIVAVAVATAARTAHADDVTWADLRSTIATTVSDPVLRDHFTMLTDSLEVFDIGDDVPSYDATIDLFTEDLAAAGEDEILLPVAEREAVWQSLAAAAQWALMSRGGGRTTTEVVETRPDEKCKDRKTATCESKPTRNCVIKRNVKNGAETKRWCETT